MSYAISRAIGKLNRCLLRFQTRSYSKSSNGNGSDSKEVIEKPSNINKEIKQQETFNTKREAAFNEERDVVEAFKKTFHGIKDLENKSQFPEHCDVFIVGGGLIGSLTGVWLKKIAPAMKVVIVERDLDYTQSSTFWSVGGFRQQFSLPENIQMSIFGTEYMREARSHLQIDHKFSFAKTPILDLPYNHDGYLFLASEKTAEQMIENHKIQLSQGAKVRLYNAEELKDEFKWINTDGIQLGSFGYEREGWVDARKFLLAARNKALSMGVDYIHGELIDFDTDEDKFFKGYNSETFSQLKRALIDTHDNKFKTINFAYAINAAGPFAADVAKMAGIGVEYEDDEDMPINSLSTALPVERRKRYIYMIKAKNGPLLNVPLTIDSTGVFFRRHNLSNVYLCGLNQDEASEPKNRDLNEIDFDYFHQRIKPVLQKRVPSFESDFELLGAWAGYYEFNTFDQNLIIGPHHIHRNFFFANGSSGHGLQHAPAISRALSEHIIYGEYKTIDLKRFSFDRIVRNDPLKEIDVV